VVSVSTLEFTPVLIIIASSLAVSGELFGVQFDAADQFLFEVDDQVRVFPPQDAKIPDSRMRRIDNKISERYRLNPKLQIEGLTNFILP